MALSWLSIWGLYLAYTWTARAVLLPVPIPALGVQGIRFYMPGLGAMALLGAWALVRVPRWVALAAVVALCGIGYWAFTGMATLDLAKPPPHAVHGALPHRVQ